MPKKSAKQVTQDVAPATNVKLYVIFHVTGGNHIKTAVESIEAGKEILGKVHKAMTEERQFFDKERGVLIKSYELVMAYITAEQVK